MKQNNIFLEFEWDAWFERNAKLLASRNLPESDPLLVEILNLPTLEKGTRILEIGCGEGGRLSWLRDNCGFDCYGIEPSAHAVEAAKVRGIAVHQLMTILLMSSRLASASIWPIERICFVSPVRRIEC